MSHFHINCTIVYSYIHIRSQISCEGVAIPQRDDVNFPYLPKRCESCRPIGMFRSSEQEFLLCYEGM